MAISSKFGKTCRWCGQRLYDYWELPAHDEDRCEVFRRLRREEQRRASRVPMNRRQ